MPAGSPVIPDSYIPGAAPPAGEEEVFVFPASFAQARLWFLDRLDPGSFAYNIHQTLRLVGELDPGALQSALTALARRHETLRTTFALHGGEPVQVVAPEGALPLARVDLRGLDPAEREGEALRLARREAHAPFDLAAGPLLRAVAVRLGEAEHLLLLTVHHIVCDGWSAGVLVRELGELYGVCAAGRPLELPELPIQYADYATWQREWLQDEVLAELLRWWRERVEGAPPVLPLPWDRPRPAARSGRGGRRPVFLGPALTEALLACGRAGGATPFMTLLAGFQVLLHRLTGQPRLLVGTPVAGRGREETEGLIGLFMNLLVMAADVDPGQGFRSLLAQVRAAALGAFARQELPFDLLVKEMGLERSLGHTPLVQVLFALQTAPHPDLCLTGLRIEPVEVGLDAAKLDLSLSLAQAEDGIRGSLEYDADLFDAPTLDRLLRSWTLLLEGAAADPEAPAGALPLLGAAERHQLLAEWGAVSAPCGGGEEPLPVPVLFARRALEQPERQALVCGGERLAFGALWRRALDIARRLRAAGVETGDLVGLCTGRTPDLVAGLLGIFAAGGAFLPLDPAHPDDRLAFLLADSGTRSFLADPDQAARVAGLAGGPAVVLPLSAEDGAAAVDLPEVPPSSPAYLIYTSGTTGRPKAVVVEHRHLASLLASMQREVGWTPADRMVSAAPFSFDIFLFEVLSPLLAGGSVALIPLRPVIDLDELVARLAEATAFHAVPSLMRQVVEAVCRVDPSRFGLRHLFVGGDSVPAELLADMAAAFPGARARVLYGPTEATILSSSLTVPADGRVAGAPLGHPLDHAVLRVVDPRGELLPAGVPGEIWIGGAGVARGYWNRSELTAERFVEREGVRFYRSGDRGRWRPDGCLEFLGRLDQQVKVRGFRIEPREIEAALLAHPGVREAVVAAREEPGGERRLVAWLVPAAGAGLPADWRAFLAGRLPDYMIPAAFVPLASLPLTAHGKVDLPALPAPAARADEPGFVAPRNPVEAVLAEIWAAVLGLGRVGVRDNFFRLGGDSILSLQIVAQARRRGLAFTARQLFETQTVEDLAPRVAAAGPAAEPEAAEEGEAPLAPVQRRFFAELPADPWHFNQTVLLEVAPEVSAAGLRRAFARVLAHHDALRLRFLPGADGWRQVHAPLQEAVVRQLPFAEVDLAALPEARWCPALEEAAAAIQGSLDPTRGPLLRGVAFGLAAGAPGRFLLAVHHLIVDGVSWRILLEDLRIALRGEPLPARTASWKRWTSHLEALARAPETAAEAAWWLALPLDDLPPLPVDHPGSAPLPGTLESVPGGLSAEETRPLLGEAPRAYNARADDLLLTALALAVARWTGDGRILLEMEGHGREEDEGIDLSRTVGWFTTTWPQLLDVRGAAGPGEALRQVKEQLRRVPRRGLGWGLLCHVAGDERLRALPRPRLTFNYLGQLDGALPAGGPLRPAPESPGPAQSPRAVRPSWLDALAGVVEGGLRVSWTYSRALFRRDTVETLARGFDAALRELIAHCLAPGAGGFTPSDFPLAGLDAAEIDRLLAEERDLANIEDILPLAPLQQGLWFHAQLAPESSAYFEQMSLVLRGGLDEGAFRRAWQHVVDRHTALRTAFVERPNGEPVQIVRRRVEVPCEVHDWSGLAPAEQEERSRAWTAADRARSFDLARPPLLRLALARLGDGLHRFFWSHHHLLMDGWCLPLVLDEVLAAYRAFRAGREPDLPASRPYRDYIAWLRRQDPAAAREVWRRALDGFDEPTPLRITRPAAGPERFAACQLRVPGPVAEALRAEARRHRLTLNTLVQGAWAWLLGRYAGRAGVVFGAVVSGRPGDLPGVESIVGLFINTLPVRVFVDAARPLDTWLAELQERQAELRQFEHTPLVEIQACSDVPRGQALFESLLAFESRPRASGESGAGAGVPPAALAADDFRPEAWTEYPLTVLCVPEGDLSFVVKHDARCFEAGAVERLTGHLSAVLESLSEGLGRASGSLSLLTAAERHQMIVEWNQTPPAWAEDGIVLDRPVHHLVEERADRHPDAPAVAFEGETLTYGELEIRANRLAHRLRELGVAADSRVGIALEHSLEMAVAVFGVLKAGGAYVGLDPEMPAERLGWILADSGACALITTARLSGRLPADLRLAVVDPEGEREELERRPARRPPPAAGEGNLVYLIYTSGSTGRPKGVLLEHRQLLSYLRGVLVPLAPRPGDTWALHQQLAVDAPVTYLFASLVTGGVLHLISRDRLARPEALGGYFVEQGIDYFKVAPSHYAALLSGSPEPARLLPRRLLMLGGEASRREWVRELQALAAPGCVLLNHYGPTETTVGSITWAADEPGLAGAPATLPMGRPLGGARIHVLDPWLDPVPVGLPGELYTGGTNLARGYHLRPDLTAERFVPDPYSPEPGARLYRSGDQMRRLPDGCPEFLGRVDHQVKIRGFRIELEEVETVLAEHPGVHTCIAGTREDAAVGLHLVAWVATAADPAPGAAELRAFLQQRLPQHMVPAVFVILPDLPRTPQGKVDRKALPAPAAPQSEGPAAADAPRTPAEELMTGLWAEVLGLGRVGLHDDFFALRGHSLLAAQIVARVRTAFGVDLPLRALFEHPTVAGLLAAVDEARGEPAAPPIRPVPREAPLPLSFAQRRLWFLDQLEPGSWAYNITRGVRLRGPLDRTALGRALAEVVRRHEVLRTRYAAVDGEPVQVIHPPGEVRLPLVDLAALPDAAREAELGHVVGRESRSPFDLARGPVLRALLVRLGKGDHAALFTVHHIACDGWSLRLMERELGALYVAFLRGAPSPLAPLPVQYADFAAWERGWLQGEVLAGHLAWWRRLLGGPLPPLELPADRPRPERLGGRGGRQALRLPGALAEQLRALGRREGATLFMVLLAGFAALLARTGGQDDLVIGADVTNRSRRETEGLIGFFINMLALRLDLSGNPPFRELLARVREVALGAYAHQDLPFEKLVEEIQPQRAAGHSPLFRVVFNFNSAVPLEGEEGDEGLPGLEGRPLAFEYETVRFDLTLLMSEAADGLNASWTYSVELFDAATVSRLHERFETLLASAAARPDLRLDALEIVGPRERSEEIERQRLREEAQRGKLLGLRARRMNR